MVIFPKSVFKSPSSLRQLFCISVDGERERCVHICIARNQLFSEFSGIRSISIPRNWKWLPFTFFSRYCALIDHFQKSPNLRSLKKKKNTLIGWSLFVFITVPYSHIPLFQVCTHSSILPFAYFKERHCADSTTFNFWVLKCFLSH